MTYIFKNCTQKIWYICGSEGDQIIWIVGLFNVQLTKNFKTITGTSFIICTCIHVFCAISIALCSHLWYSITYWYSLTTANIYCYLRYIGTSDHDPYLPVICIYEVKRLKFNNTSISCIVDHAKLNYILMCTYIAYIYLQC